MSKKAPIKGKKTRASQTSPRLHDKGINDAEYERFVKGLAVRSIGLMNCSCNLNRDALIAAFDSDHHVFRKLNQELSVASLSQDGFSSEARFQLQVFSESDNPFLTA